MANPSLPTELLRHIISYLAQDRQALCILCLVTSTVRSLAIQELYARLCFRSWHAIESCFCGRSSRKERRKKDEEAAWKATGMARVLERRVRELRYVKEIEFVGLRSTSGPDLKLPTCLTDSGPFPINTLRLSLASMDRCSSLLRILSPLRLIVHTNQIHSILSDLALSIERPLTLDICAPRPPLLLNLAPGLIDSVIWSCLNVDRVPSQSDLIQLISYSSKTRIVLLSMQVKDRTDALLGKLRAEQAIGNKAVDVVVTSQRRVRLVDGRVEWNDG